MKPTPILVSLFSLATLTAPAQEIKVPAPSPSQTVKQAFALSDISIEYSRPSANGRVVFGDLVPYDKVWRTGANYSTKITFGEEIRLEGSPVQAGTYALYTIPGKSEWTIILSKNVNWWGAYAYTEDEDLLRVKVKPATMTTAVETFNISFDNISARSVILTLMWEKTRVPIAITTDIDAVVMKSIEEAMKPVDDRPFMQAAAYYYENGKDLNKALEWVNQAIVINPKAYWAVLLKARIQVKLKDNKGAVATGEQVVALAKEDKNEEYITLGQKVIAEAKKTL